MDELRELGQSIIIALDAPTENHAQPADFYCVQCGRVFTACDCDFDADPRFRELGIAILQQYELETGGVVGRAEIDEVRFQLRRKFQLGAI